MTHQNAMDFQNINQQALSRLREIVESITGQTGQVQGRELLIRNPRREDASVGSFSINLDKGLWKDFASNDGGGDPISLVAFLQGHGSQGQAMRWLADYLGCQVQTEVKAVNRKEQARDYPRPVFPVPIDAGQPGPQSCEEGRWEWKDMDGRLLKVTIRTHDARRGKLIHPWTWCEVSKGRFAWFKKDLPEPRPLFGLDRLAEASQAPILVVEGEKTAQAAAKLFPAHAVVTSGSSSSARKADWSPLRERDVTIWPDADDAGSKYLLAVESCLRNMGVASLHRVAIPDSLPKGWDLADPVPEGLDLEGLMQSAVPLELHQETVPTAKVNGLPNHSGCYLIHEDRMCLQGKNGDPRHLCNFVARITEELVMDDGENQEVVFLVEGKLADGRPLPTAQVPAAAFGTLGWVMSQWGARAIVSAGTTTKDQLRACIQHLSKPSRGLVFLSTGWKKITQDWIFLHAGGAIGPRGPVDGISMDLKGRLAQYQLGRVLQGEDLIQAFRSSLRLLELGPESVTAAVWLAIFRVVIDTCPFSLHVSGSKGSGKTEMASIAAGHFGASLSSKELLESWESTCGSLERTCFLAKDVLGVVDDFRPGEGGRERQDMAKKADRLLRGAHNRNSRSRLASDSKNQNRAYWSRGLILSTGEDLPPGESLRSRVICLEWPASAMNWETLGQMQEARRQGLHSDLMASFIQWLAGDRAQAMKIRSKAHEEACRRLRALSRNNRTGDIAADLWSAWPVLEAFARDLRIVSEGELALIRQRIWGGFLEMTGAQAAIIADASPAERFREALKGLLASGRCHLAHGEPGILPSEWHVRCGWIDGLARGLRIGFISLKKREIWLIPAAAFREIDQLSPLGIGERAMWGRLLEANDLVPERPGRNKARRTTGDGVRQDFIVMRLSALWPEGQSGELAHAWDCSGPRENHTSSGFGADGTSGPPEQDDSMPATEEDVF